MQTGKEDTLIYLMTESFSLIRKSFEHFESIFRTELQNLVEILEISKIGDHLNKNLKKIFF